MIFITLLLLPISISASPKPKFIFAYDLNNHTNDENIKIILNLTEQAVNQYKTDLIEKGNFPGVTIEGFTGDATEEPKKFCNDEKESFLFPKPADFNGNATNTTTALEQMKDRLQNMSPTDNSFVVQVSVSTFQFSSTPPQSLMVNKNETGNFTSVLIISQSSSRRSARDIPSGNTVFNIQDPTARSTFSNDFTSYIKDEMKRLSRGEVYITSTTTASTTTTTAKPPSTKYALPLQKIQDRLDSAEMKLSFTCLWCCWIVVGIAAVVLLLALIIIMCLVCYQREVEENLVNHEGVQTTEKHLDPDSDEPSRLKWITKKVVVVETEEQDDEEEMQEPDSEPDQPPEPKQPAEAKFQNIDINVTVHTAQPDKKKKTPKNDQSNQRAPPKQKGPNKQMMKKMTKNDRNQISAARIT